MIYLYHPQVPDRPHARLENFKPMPDGLIRVHGREAEKGD